MRRSEATSPCFRLAAEELEPRDAAVRDDTHQGFLKILSTSSTLLWSMQTPIHQSDEALFLGIDLGTGGVRTILVTERGSVVGTTSVAFDADTLAPQEGRHEQQPEMWWNAVCGAVSATLGKLDAKDRQRLTAVAVDGTSGTLVAVARGGTPLRPALMYNDPRASSEAAALNAAAGAFCMKLGYQFNASFALTKIAWLRSREPAVFERTSRFLHQADFVVEQLTGEPATTDYSNALKTGYDLIDECWPAWIDSHLGVVARLPRVVAPGEVIGTISAQAAQQTGLPQGLSVVAGASDGTAAFLASGSRRPGDYNTTLGTTLVFKGDQSTNMPASGRPDLLSQAARRLVAAGCGRQHRSRVDWIAVSRRRRPGVGRSRRIAAAQRLPRLSAGPQRRAIPIFGPSGRGIFRARAFGFGRSLCGMSSGRRIG